ncbi:MAG: hypothetical protein ACYS1A_16840 [Planctomycetota bacterium]|jgi:hypothetical protein
MNMDATLIVGILAFCLAVSEALPHLPFFKAIKFWLKFFHNFPPVLLGGAMLLCLACASFGTRPLPCEAGLQDLNECVMTLEMCAKKLEQCTMEIEGR